MPRTRARRSPVFDDLTTLERLKLADELPDVATCRANGFPKWEAFGLNFPQAVPPGPRRERYRLLGFLDSE